MASKKVSACPWSTAYPDHASYTNPQYGWHIGQRLFAPYVNRRNSDTVLDGHTFHSGVGTQGTDESKAHEIWSNGGFTTKLNNGKNYSTTVLLGTKVNASGFADSLSGYKYPDDSISSFLPNVIGFGFMSSAEGSYSDSGGDAQAYVVKVGLMYVKPSNGWRFTAIADRVSYKSFPMGTKYVDNSTYEHYSYLLSNTDIETVKNGDYRLTGMAIEYFHGHKGMSRDSACKIKHLRMIVGNSSTLITGKPNRLLVANDYATTFAQLKAGKLHVGLT